MKIDMPAFWWGAQSVSTEGLTDDQKVLVCTFLGAWFHGFSVDASPPTKARLRLLKPALVTLRMRAQITAEQHAEMLACAQNVAGEHESARLVAKAREMAVRAASHAMAHWVSPNQKIRRV